MARVLDPLPGYSVIVVDERSEWRTQLPETLDRLDDVETAVAFADDDAQHFILTHCHTLDFDLCNKLLRRQTGGIGLIGSKTKWARFRKRLVSLGHAYEHVETIQSPIGDPALGKHPQAIAISVAAQLMNTKTSHVEKRGAA